MFRLDRKACSTDDMSSKQMLVFKLGLGTVAGFCLWQLDIVPYIRVSYRILYVTILYKAGIYIGPYIYAPI